MEYLRMELSRILSNGIGHTLPSLSAANDEGHLNAHGDSVLHLSLSLHSTDANELINLVKKISQHPNHYDHDASRVVSQVNTSGVTPLHVAVYRNSWHVAPIVEYLLAVCPEMASLPSKSFDGSSSYYPLHVLVSESRTIHPRVLELLLEKSDPSIVTHEDIYGDNPLSLLYQNVLRFQWAKSWECTGTGPADYYSCRPSFAERNSSPVGKRHRTANTTSDIRKRQSWMTVISPDQFCEYSLQIIRAAVADKHHGKPGKILTWHHICKASRCPPLLVRVLLHEYNQFHRNGNHEGKNVLPYQWIKGSFLDADEFGRVPLHHACSAPSIPSSMSSNSVIELILQAAPLAAWSKDSRGRLPLHYAVSNESLLQSFFASSTIKALLAANTDALTVQDPITRLYPFELLAASFHYARKDSSWLYTTELSSDEKISKKEESKELKGHVKQVMEEYAVESLDLLNYLIRTDPSVCAYH